jgi:hypothetical protein
MTGDLAALLGDLLLVLPPEATPEQRREAGRAVALAIIDTIVDVVEVRMLDYELRIMLAAQMS